MSNDNLPISDSKLSTGEDVQAHGFAQNFDVESADKPFNANWDADGAVKSEDVEAHRFQQMYDAEGADGAEGADVAR